MFVDNSAGERGQVGIGTLIVFIAMVLVAAIAAGVLINTAGMLQSQAEATGEESTDLVSERIDTVSEVGVVSDFAVDPTDSDEWESGADRGQLEAIRISVTGAAGSDDIDLSETVIQAVGPHGQANLVLADASDTVDTDDGFAQVNAQYTETWGGSDWSSGSIDNGAGTSTTDAEAWHIADGYFAVENSEGKFVSAEEAVLEDDNDELTIVLNPVIEPFGTLDNEDNDDTDLHTLADGEEAFGAGDESTLDIVSPSGATTQVELNAPDLFSEDGEAVRL